MKNLGKLALLGAALAVSASSALADILPAFTSPTVTAAGGGFNWTYDATLTSSEELQTGNFFVIYDFGVGSLVSAPVGWTLTTSAFGPTTVTGSNGTVTPNDSSALNYKFTYTGSMVLGPSDLGDFVLFSPSGTSQTAAWVGQATDQSHPLLLDANITNISVPTATPEPNSLMLLGTGLMGGAGMLMRRRRRATV